MFNNIPNTYDCIFDIIRIIYPVKSNPFDFGSE